MKKYHMAHLVSNRGDMSALCFSTPRPIDLSKASWTLRQEAVTCGKCQQKLRERQQAAGRP